MASALFRLRERDFGELRHTDGVSPAWPLGYDVFEPYYCEAEALFHVHGQRGEDPTEPWSSTPYAYAPVSHEPRIQALNDAWKEGLHPFHLPLGILWTRRTARRRLPAPCIRCDAFDGFPCAINAKADAQVICVDPTLTPHPKFHSADRRLRVAARDRCKRTHRRQVSGHARGRSRRQYSADIVVVACGALSSALLLLRSANDKHPHGSGERLGSGRAQLHASQHEHPDGAAEGAEQHGVPEDARVERLLLRRDDWHYPLGLIQMCATSHGEQIRGEALPSWLDWLPDMPFEKMANTRWISGCRAKICPARENRIYYDGDKVVLGDHRGRRGGRQRLKHNSKACWRVGAPRICWNAACIWARTSRSTAPPTRQAPAFRCRSQDVRAGPGLQGP